MCRASRLWCRVYKPKGTRDFLGTITRHHHQAERHWQEIIRINDGRPQHTTRQSFFKHDVARNGFCAGIDHQHKSRQCFDDARHQVTADGANRQIHLRLKRKLRGQLPDGVSANSGVERGAPWVAKGQQLRR